ncbi:hypothetical protein M0R45_028641 [Rubus argutus]|uniref:Uncharacterized protein n=1 Tax=Rubus argutus TaxID=59490 RepID=A0AAW1W676_RUBAR
MTMLSSNTVANSLSEQGLEKFIVSLKMSPHELGLFEADLLNTLVTFSGRTLIEPPLTLSIQAFTNFIQKKWRFTTPKGHESSTVKVKI